MTTLTNPFDWDLPLTDAMLYDESPYEALPDPAQNIAERLTFLVHLGFDVDVWGGNTGRLDRYWDAFRERIESATNQEDVAAWWGMVVADMPCRRMRNLGLIHEKNLLTRPASLYPQPVADADVLAVWRVHSHDLRDRCQVWARARRDLRNAIQDEDH